LLIGGAFQTLLPAGGGAFARTSIARLNNAFAIQTLSVPDASQILWVRGGSAPELTGVTFEVSPDGGRVWISLGAGERVGSSASWQLTGLSLPAGNLVRARGTTS